MAIFLTTGSQPINADYQDGLDAYNVGDFSRAFYEWNIIANSPAEESHPGLYAESLFGLAMLYWLGQGVQQNTSTSASWLARR